MYLLTNITDVLHLSKKYWLSSFYLTKFRKKINFI